MMTDTYLLKYARDHFKYIQMLVEYNLFNSLLCDTKSDSFINYFV
jgi:hypothetical protein